MITVKVPNVLEPEQYERLKLMIDSGLVLLVMQPEGDVDSQDCIGQVENILEQGIDFEVLISVTEPHRFVADSAFVFEEHNKEKLLFLVQKEPWQSKKAAQAS
jgi:hypothetical protein